MGHNLYEMADRIVTALKPEFSKYTIERAGSLLHHVDQVYDRLPAIWVAPGPMDRDGDALSQNFLLDQEWNVSLVLPTAEPIRGIDAGTVLFQIITALDGWRVQMDSAHTVFLRFSGAGAPEFDRGTVSYPATFTTRLPVTNKRT